MKKIRFGVFETNSSSTHTITINGKLKKDLPKSIFKGKSIVIRLEDCEFGWGFDFFTDAHNKLKYAIMMVIETEAGKCEKLEDVYNLEGFKTIKSVVKEDIILEDDKFCQKSFIRDDGSEHRYLEHSGYIDHQSRENYKSLKDFLDDNEIDILNFIYNTNVDLIISNDNY